MFEDIEALVQAGKWDEAEPLLQDFVAKHPEHGMGHARLGMCLGRKGEIEPAAVQFQRAWALDPRDWDSGKNLLKCYEHLGNHKEALVVAHDILRMRPSDQDVSSLVERCTAALKAQEPDDDRSMVWGR